LLRGHSGVRVQTVQLMAALLNNDILPIVPNLGSVGASGDLAPLSHLALPLIGEGDVICQGEKIAAKKALKNAGLRPVQLGPKEGLALNNGTAQMLATAVLLLDELAALCAAADINAALALEAFCGRGAAFDPRAHALRPHPGQVATARLIAELTAGSGLLDMAYHLIPRWQPADVEQADIQDDPAFDFRFDYIPPAERDPGLAVHNESLPFRGGKRAQPQDAYSLRCVPQVHGAVKDALAHLARVADIELNAVTDNPLIFFREDSTEVDVVSAGNFHGMPLALALAAVKAAIATQGSICERRLNKLLDPATNDGLPPFLVANPDGTDSGMMILQYSAAAMVNELATLATPSCVYNIPTSANAEDHVSMGTNDARAAWQMMQTLQKIIAIEYWVALQALECRIRILDAVHQVAADKSCLRLRDKLRNVSVMSAASTVLNSDVEDFRFALLQLGDLHASKFATGQLRLLRESGVAFLAVDRFLQPDLMRCQVLIERRASVLLAEEQLKRGMREVIA
jgi:histidine ammonia-lyase